MSSFITQSEGAGSGSGMETAGKEGRIRYRSFVFRLPSKEAADP